MSDGHLLLFSLCVSWLWVFVAQTHDPGEASSQYVLGKRATPRRTDEEENDDKENDDTKGNRHEHRSANTNESCQGRYRSRKARR
ncbi:hypothetical protein J8I87_00695 [Paraburkholderia sp. LEh10]|uniref:hypothetical protein n=1 Tax=Paraburkholderia sp. LEh10 TaxID=2821353 RepID=UPI001AE71CC2|nr:hypothetical protein [Paraburkholderia sp. LEh10]MBP0588261.1 hypothetical protein [Paraburkholderia sp. LEh10]